MIRIATHWGRILAPAVLSLAFTPSVTRAQDACPAEPQRFVDVAPTSPYYHVVNNLRWHGITKGCAVDAYCPDSGVTRAQMAIFLLRARYSSGYVPPPATGLVFSDVRADDFGADYIEHAYNEGIISPCGTGRFCPEGSVSRGDMAVFLLKAEEGGAYAPAACTSDAFNDVPMADPLCPWVKELYTRGITAGCSPGNYCPTAAQTRGHMAVFMTRTFKLRTPLDSPFGIVATGGGRMARDPRMQADIATVGAGWVRANLQWNEMEHVKGQINFTEADDLVNSMEAQGGLYLYWDFSYTPCWASGETCLPGHETQAQKAKPPLNNADLYNFVYQVVSRFKGRNIYWGTWNEANYEPFYAGGVAHYAANGLKATINAIRDADPNAKIVLGELQSKPNISDVFTDLKMLIDNAPRPFDVISQHIYDGNATCGGRVAMVDTLRSKLVEWGQGSKPLWITETGESASHPDKSALLQCFYGSMESRPWWAKTFWYKYEVEQNNAGVNIGLTEGAVEPVCELTPAQSYASYQAVAKKTLDLRLDVDRSSYSDLLLRNTQTGDNSAWQLRNAVFAGETALPPNGDLGWKIVGTGDFNKDGSADWLWRNQSGGNWVWVMEGATWRDDLSFHLPNQSLPWEVGGVSDFNTDGFADIAWLNPSTGATEVWFTGGQGIGVTTRSLGQASTGTRMVATGNFSWDNLPDAVYRNDSTGTTSITYYDIRRSLVIVGGGALTPSPDSTWRLVAAADFNKDNKTDLVWQQTTTGQLEAWLMDGIVRTKVVALPALPPNTAVVGPR